MSEKEVADNGDNIELSCPCCRTKLVVDRSNGEILFEERPKRSGFTWDEALQARDAKQAEAEKMFAKGMDRQRNADEILDKKFKEALKRADKSDDPPPRIFDLD